MTEKSKTVAKPKVGSANWKPLTPEQYAKLSPEERAKATAELKEHLAHLVDRVSKLKVELEEFIGERCKDRLNRKLKQIPKKVQKKGARKGARK